MIFIIECLIAILKQAKTWRLKNVYRSVDQKAFRTLDLNGKLSVTVVLNQRKDFNGPGQTSVKIDVRVTLVKSAVDQMLWAYGPRHQNAWMHFVFTIFPETNAFWLGNHILGSTSWPFENVSLFAKWQDAILIIFNLLIFFLIKNQNHPYRLFIFWSWKRRFLLLWISGFEIYSGPKIRM